MEYRSPVCRARICRKSPLIFQHPSFILARRNNRHHFRVSSRMMPMPPGYTKVFGFAPTWCTTKYLARSCGVFFYCLFLRELPFVHHWGREWLAVEVTAACGGNREPEQAQRSQRTSPAQGVQADAVTASRRLAVRPAGQKQSSGRFLERGGFYASPRICLISAKSAAK